MTTIKLDILLLHAGWHTPASYSALIEGLEKENFKVHAPLLPTMNGDRPPKADLYVDTDFVREYATELADKGVSFLVLMHSYGGQVGTNALAGLGTSERARAGKVGGVERLIYMTAHAMSEGSSLIGWVEAQGQKDLLPLVFDFQDDGFVVSRYPRELVVGEGFLSDAEMEKYLDTFTSWVSKSWSDELQHCAWRGIPVTYIQALQDKTTPLDYQKGFVDLMIAAGSTEVDVLAVDTGHCPHVTATAEIRSMIKSIAMKNSSAVNAG